MFEIDNAILRSVFLSKIGGIEKKVSMQIDVEKIKAVPETDIDRTSAEGKASSVQFLHFNFSDEQIKKFKHPNTQVSISIDHNLYGHETKISKNTKNALIEDFI